MFNFGSALDFWHENWKKGKIIKNILAQKFKVHIFWTNIRLLEQNIVVVKILYHH